MIPLILLVLSTCAHATESKAGLSIDDRTAIQQKIQDYVQAFVKGDEGMLRNSVTESYVEDQGGWEHFRELLAKFKDKWSKGARAVSIEVRAGDPGSALAHYEIHGPNGRLSGLGSSMLVLRKEAGVWKFDRLVPDAYRGSK